MQIKSNAISCVTWNLIESSYNYKAWDTIWHTSEVLFTCSWCQVAGRLHVEVMRMGGGCDDSVAGGDESDGSPDGDAQERKLVYVVSTEVRRSKFCACKFWET